MAMLTHTFDLVANVNFIRQFLFRHLHDSVPFLRSLAFLYKNPQWVIMSWFLLLLRAVISIWLVVAMNFLTDKSACLRKASSELTG